MIDLNCSACMIHIDAMALERCYTCGTAPLRHRTNEIEQWKYFYLRVKGDMTPLSYVVDAYHDEWFMKLSSVSVNPP